MTSVAIIICTRNPDVTSFERVLESLRGQTFPQSEWSLLVVDNGSRVPIDASLLGWHSNFRIVQEQERGLAAARISGVYETDAPLLVFVDDDNVLAPDYIEQAFGIASRHPWLGAFGGGASPVYAVAPSPELLWIADASALKRDLTAPAWSNLYRTETTPAGAGLVIRREVGLFYANSTPAGSLFRPLNQDRKKLVICEDTDLAWSAIDLGLGCGTFPQLRFKHLIGAERVTLDFLISAVEHFAYSWVMLHRWRGLPLPPAEDFASWSRRLFTALTYFRQTKVSKALARARWRGHARGNCTTLEQPRHYLDK